MDELPEILHVAVEPRASRSGCSVSTPYLESILQSGPCTMPTLTGWLPAVTVFRHDPPTSTDRVPVPNGDRPRGYLGMSLAAVEGTHDSATRATRCWRTLDHCSKDLLVQGWPIELDGPANCSHRPTARADAVEGCCNAGRPADLR